MTKRITRYVAVLAACLTASACATTGGGSASLSPDQKALRDYTTDYTVTGAVAGAALGCVAGALLSNNKGAGCAAGAVAGGALGAGGGYYLAQRQKTVGQQSVDYAAERDALNREVAQAQQTVAAAHRVVANTKAELQTLKRQVASNQATRQQLEARAKTAEQDREAMLEASKKIQDNIDQLDKDVRSGRGDSKTRAFLETKRRQLVEENKKLQRDADLLGGFIGDAGTATS